MPKHEKVYFRTFEVLTFFFFFFLSLVCFSNFLLHTPRQSDKKGSHPTLITNKKNKKNKGYEEKYILFNTIDVFVFLNKQVIVKDLFIKDKMTKRERDFSCLAFFSLCM